VHTKKLHAEPTLPSIRLVERCFVRRNKPSKCGLIVILDMWTIAADTKLAR